MAERASGVRWSGEQARDAHWLRRDAGRPTHRRRGEVVGSGNNPAAYQDRSAVRYRRVLGDSAVGQPLVASRRTVC